MFLDDSFLRICLTLYSLKLKEIKIFKFSNFFFYGCCVFDFFFLLLAFFPGTDSSTILWMSTLVLGIKEFNKYFMWNGGGDIWDFGGEWGEIPY